VRRARGPRSPARCGLLPRVPGRQVENSGGVGMPLTANNHRKDSRMAQRALQIAFPERAGTHRL